MVDPAIEPEQHPLRHVPAGQKTAGRADQVVEIQPSARRLGLRVAGQKRLREAVHGVRAPRGQKPHAQRPRLGHALCQRVIGRHQIGPHRLPHACIGDGLGLALLFARLGQTSRLQFLKIGQLHRRPGHHAQPFSQLRLRLDLGIEMSRERGGQISLGPIERGGQHRLLRQIGRNPRPVADRRPIPGLGQRLGLPGHRAGELGQTVVIAQGRRRQIERALHRPVLGHLVEQIGDQPGLHPLVDLGEAGADARLQRETPQDRGAEGMDRLDLQSARRLDRTGE